MAKKEFVPFPVLYVRSSYGKWHIVSDTWRRVRVHCGRYVYPDTFTTHFVYSRRRPSSWPTMRLGDGICKSCQRTGGV